MGAGFEDGRRKKAVRAVMLDVEGGNGSYEQLMMSSVDASQSKVRWEEQRRRRQRYGGRELKVEETR